MATISLSQAPYEGLVKSVTPDQLIQIYDATGFALELAAHGMRAGDADRQREGIRKGQHFLAHLSAILRYDDSPITIDLQCLYLNLVQRLVLANAYQDPAAVDEVIDILRELRNAWSDAVTRVFQHDSESLLLAA